MKDGLSSLSASLTYHGLADCMELILFSLNVYDFIVINEGKNLEQMAIGKSVLLQLNHNFAYLMLLIMFHLY